MRIAVLSSISWRTPHRSYGPWEQVASNVTEGLVARGHEEGQRYVDGSTLEARVEVGVRAQ